MESNIRKLRKEREISQSELADAIGMSQQVISRMENDRNRIRIRSLIALADYFHVSTDEVLGYKAEIGKKEERSAAWETESRERSAQTEVKPLAEGGQSAVYDLLISMKRCLEECGI